MRHLIITTILLTLSACAPANTNLGVPPTSTEPACTPTPIHKTDFCFPEVQGTMKSVGTLWGLYFFDTARVNQDLKFVWRVSGNGVDMTIQAQNEDGMVIQPVWGPDYHGSSTWQHPGLEWGTGFNFPEPGCWTITIGRGATSGSIHLDVLPTLPVSTPIG
jgi:hypothetical protein